MAENIEIDLKCMEGLKIAATEFEETESRDLPIYMTFILFY